MLFETTVKFNIPGKTEDEAIQKVNNLFAPWMEHTIIEFAPCKTQPKPISGEAVVVVKPPKPFA